MRPSDILQINRAALRQLTDRYGVLHPRIFGSVLTGADTEDSDLDLLVNPSQSTTLLTLSALQNDAEKLLGVHVSVLTPRAVPAKFRDQVPQQALPL